MFPSREQNCRRTRMPSDLAPRPDGAEGGVGPGNFDDTGARYDISEFFQHVDEDLILIDLTNATNLSYF